MTPSRTLMIASGDRPRPTRRNAGRRLVAGEHCAARPRRARRAGQPALQAGHVALHQPAASSAVAEPAPAADEKRSSEKQRRQNSRPSFASFASRAGKKIFHSFAPLRFMKKRTYKRLSRSEAVFQEREGLHASVSSTRIDDQDRSSAWYSASRAESRSAKALLDQYPAGPGAPPGAPLGGPGRRKPGKRHCRCAANSGSAA